MILDLEQFIEDERPYWDELEQRLNTLESDMTGRPDVEFVRRLHYLYQRAATDLARVNTFAAEPELRRYLESLVARAYGDIHEVRRGGTRLAPIQWFFGTFPRTFRSHWQAFALAVVITLAGGLLGGGALAFDPQAKSVLMPFQHLQIHPSERVEMEESMEEDRLSGRRTQFSAFLMKHNTRVSILTMAFGVTYGLGTTFVLFQNGVMLGAVIADYVGAGETLFLVGWLLPHGSIEIPAILLAGQAGLVLAGAMIGWRSRESLKQRLRNIGPDLLTLILGVAVMLVWAGIIEGFFSQYHEPFLPYWLKAAFGTLELTALIAFLALSGRTE